MPLLFLLFAAVALPAHGESINAAVAANFRETFEVLREHFTAQSGIEVAPSYGASGMLYTQIKLGAPFAVFLSADAERPELLENDGIAVANSRFVYAIGALVLWTRGQENPTAEWLRDETHRIAIANPEIAPYGRAATEVLARLGVLPAGAKRVVTGNSVAQTMHFAVTGAVDGALVARAQALQLRAPASEMWVVPTAMHAPIEQSAVAVKGSNAQAALALLHFLRTPESRALIVSHGYEVTP